MAGLQVFGQPASTDVARVLTCLFEKNRKFELVRADKFNGQPNVPEFIKLQASYSISIFVHAYRCLQSLFTRVVFTL